MRDKPNLFVVKSEIIKISPWFVIRTPVFCVTWFRLRILQLELKVTIVRSQLQPNSNKCVIYLF